MKKLVLFYLAIIPVVLSAQVNYNSGGSYQAFSSAQSSGKYVLVSFEASWCQPCKWMKTNVYQANNVVNKINREYVAVKANMDNTNEWSTRYEVNVLPYAIILDQQGNKIADLEGTASANEFNMFLDCKCQVKAPSAPIPVYASMANNITSEADRYWTVQIGKYVGSFYAKKLQEKASQNFEDVHILHEQDKNGKDIYRVFVGLFVDENTAKYTLDFLRNQGYKGFTKYL